MWNVTSKIVNYVVSLIYCAQAMKKKKKILPQNFICLK